MKRFIAVFMMCMMLFSMVGCAPKNQVKNEEVALSDWDTVLKEAKGTTVSFYGWGGDPRINQWLDGYVGKELKEKYDITLNRVPMDIDDILNKLLGEKQINAENGTIDVVWINGENFYTAKKNGLLYGPFTDKLPNFNQYVDTASVETQYDFGFPVEGHEAPYGRAQMVMIYDEARVDQAPKNHEELAELVKKNPGKFTYPAPPDFTGSAFIRNIIYDIVGYEQFTNMQADKETIKKEIQPAIDYLKALKPYLWKEGKTYPATVAQLDNMFADQEVFMSMSYQPFGPAGKIETGEFPGTTNTFVFDKGTIGNTHFMAIPYNAPNKNGAMAVIDFILSVEAQASKYDPKTWGDLSVLDYAKLNAEEKSQFDNIKLGKGTLSIDVLQNHRMPEMPANLIPIIEEIWQEEIFNEGE